jgi:hypothetical protein
MVFSREQAVARINELVQKADDHLHEALRLADEYGIPFTFEMNAFVDQPVWESSDDHWYGSGC